MWPKYLAVLIALFIFFFRKNSLILNIFSTREDSTAKNQNNKKCLQEGAFGKKMIT